MELQGRIVVERLASDLLRGNPLGDPAERDLYIYLPPSYDRDPARHYPTVYVLAGFAGRGETLLNVHPFVPNIVERLDRLIASGEAGEMILVMPDCFTRLGGSQYINSTATGRYEDYLIDEIVPFVDAHFRTRAAPAGRAIMGKSSGGYGALVQAMRHPDVFSVVAAHSADCYFEYCYLPDFVKAFRAIKGDPASFLERFWRDEKRGKDDFAALNIIAMSACYSPDPDTTLGYRLPFDLQTGELIEDVWQRWREHDPVRLIERHVEDLRRLKMIYLDAGTRDEFAIDLGTRILASHLRQFGIEFIHEEFNDGHFNVSYRYNRSFALVSQALDEASSGG
jgi:S-formylglutathione hydrolase FrmB